MTGWPNAWLKKKKRKEKRMKRRKNEVKEILENEDRP